MLAAEQPERVTAMDWVMVAMAAQRNVFRIYGDKRATPIGQLGIEVIARAAGCGVLDALILSVEFAVEPDRMPLTDEPVLATRMLDRIAHQSGPYQGMRGLHALDFADRVRCTAPFPHRPHGGCPGTAGAELGLGL